MLLCRSKAVWRHNNFIQLPSSTKNRNQEEKKKPIPKPSLSLSGKKAKYFSIKWEVNPFGQRLCRYATFNNSCLWFTSQTAHALPYSFPVFYPEKPWHTLEFLPQQIWLGLKQGIKTCIVRNVNEESANAISRGKFNFNLRNLMLKLTVGVGQITASLIKTQANDTMPTLLQLTSTLFTCSSKTTFLPFLYWSFICSVQHMSSSTFNYFSPLGSW